MFFFFLLNSVKILFLLREKSRSCYLKINDILEIQMRITCTLSLFCIF